MPSTTTFGPLHDYCVDAWQRSILFLDVLRQRGNIYQEQKAKAAPNVLEFDCELVMDGRTLPRPVNYALVRIVPPPGIAIDPDKRPFVIVDPRAGHGPGIGGMKQDSEIGVAMAAGHACYFIGFLPEPLPDQTIEDVWTAEAAFIEAVATLHSDAAGKPAVIANCQAGWQTMIMAATNPDVPGPLVLVGSPLSYWEGVRHKNPMRYTGGVLGGTWMTRLAGDMGGGIFDGASLIANFESLDPAHSYWQKPYNVYANVDSEAERFLDFETWWGSPVLLNAGEMQWIADNLFVGNKLSNGQLRTADGVRIDLRNVKSPIVLFCSWGDNITPPQQALGWITDVYRDDDEIVANGQTIVYTLHQSIGHLGIFVSGKVATKEHSELTGCMDMIDLLPPGLYEAVISEVDKTTDNPALIDGRYLLSLNPRTLDDIRALGCNSPEDEMRFAVAGRVSEANLQLYELTAGPVIRSLVTDTSAEAGRRLHPNRLRFSLFSDLNPSMRLVANAADLVRRDRKPVAADNPFLVMERAASEAIEASLCAWGKARDAMTEQYFLQAYGSPVLRALTGLDPEALAERRRPDQDISRKSAQARRRDEAERRFDKGGIAEAMLRAIGYILSAEGGLDERNFAVLRALHAAQPPGQRRTIAALKTLFSEQSLLLRMDEDRAVAEIPGLLPQAAEKRRLALAAVRRAVLAQGQLSGEGEQRLARIETLFGGSPEGAAPRKEIQDADA